mmetsp:Transcript_9535/g.27894  ORF Transcript_9535/g.27894 Transcript_9535/m.27894 type:complete len:205 (-) Transcript_9535:1440-2054(-)
MVQPPMGGRKTSMSVRVISSGYMPPVCSKRAWRRATSVTPKRLATPGRCHTGSTAHLTPCTTPSAVSTLPSGLRRPDSMASLISVMESAACDTAMLGCRSTPRSAAEGKASSTRAPQGSMETILSLSAQEGWGPMRTMGCVAASSRGRPGGRRPFATAAARCTAVAPEWQPMALRNWGLDKVATTGPRSAEVAAPHLRGTGSTE